MSHPPRIALTPGEPAGIGPDITLQLLLHESLPADIIVIANRAMLEQRAQLLGLAANFYTYQIGDAIKPHAINVHDVPLPVMVQPGKLNPQNAHYVLETLQIATRACLNQEVAALVTAPVHKSVINDAGIAFSGHTEYLAHLTHAPHVVMLLVADTLRVSLVTTHLPLAAVPQAITVNNIITTVKILEQALRQRFHIINPKILVCGLNPHAGENGYLGNEEITTIIPALEKLKAEGIDVQGPLPADTIFTPPYLREADAIVAMYHDQGLPVLKHAGFGHAINVTLGLPIVRTSVDHGTALKLAGTGQANWSSLRAAVLLAAQLARK